jgi:hypothetical protein
MIQRNFPAPVWLDLTTFAPQPVVEHFVVRGRVHCRLWQLKSSRHALQSRENPAASSLAPEVRVKCRPPAAQHSSVRSIQIRPRLSLRRRRGSTPTATRLSWSSVAHCRDRATQPVQQGCRAHIAGRRSQHRPMNFEDRWRVVYGRGPDGTERAYRPFAFAQAR